MAVVSLRIIGRDLPGRECGEYRNIHVAVQRGREPEGAVPGDAAEAVWEFTVETVVAPDGTPDFRGPYVHGRRGARFLYLTWGEQPPGGPFTMFRRAKLFLDDLPAEALDRGTAEGELGLTDSCGMARCAAVRPPDITWSY
ncbi:hypothetical protein CDO52_01625 [Nocardiopsis gilva YIM 90087]|uniref:Monooxygenase n=1 Tax=Nocardiopsis gilva YIM 90087 TaxID=1235441 RepID=A0A223S0M7_9ACTN|nr:DUF5990 family protein [Nocardiopsis gilva]ASU81668.1 hypothetical protein CDO52_01625 [Nocardiopsis gilva YIM 90087]